MNSKTTIIGNGTVVKRTANDSFIKNGAVVFNEEEILDVGPEADMKAKFSDADYIDAKNGYIMPGFINPHEHCYSAMVRGMALTKYRPTTFMENLSQKWWNLDRALTKEQITVGTQAFLIDAAKNGVTTEFEHNASFGYISGSLELIAGIAGDVGIRICPCFEVSDRWGMETAKEAVDENIRWMNYCKAAHSDMIAATMGLHASFTISDQTFDYIKNNYPVENGCHIHIAEAMEDVKDCEQKYGISITKRLDQWGLLNDKTIIAHGVYLSEEEMNLIKQKDAMVVNNPESNMNNAVDCPPTIKLLEKGIVTGLGMDGFTHDMFLAWRIANALFKFAHHDINAAWAELPEMIFHGNRIIGERYFGRKMGVLAKGAVPDMIVVNYDGPTLVNENTFNSHMLFGMNGSNIKMTICAGKVIVKDGECLTLDEEKVLYESRKESEKLWKLF